MLHARSVEQRPLLQRFQSKPARRRKNRAAPGKRFRVAATSTITTLYVSAHNRFFVQWKHTRPRGVLLTTCSPIYTGDVPRRSQAARKMSGDRPDLARPVGWHAAGSTRGGPHRPSMKWSAVADQREALLRLYFRRARPPLAARPATPAAISVAPMIWLVLSESSRS